MLEEAVMQERRRLPDERQSITRKFEIAGHDLYLTVGLYDDGTPGETFWKSSKEGSTLAGLLDTIGVLFSLALQHGVPLRAITNKLAYTRFEPAGFTGIPGVQYATSPVDAVVRWMAGKFLPPEEAPQPTLPMASVPPRAEAAMVTSDAPPCDKCGHLMRRIGSSGCLICPNCMSTEGSCG